MQSHIAKIVALCAALFSGIAFADEYGAEIRIASLIDLDTSASDTTALRGTIYIFGANYDDIPRAEVGFLTHASNMYLETTSDGEEFTGGLELYGDTSYFHVSSDGDFLVARLGFFARENMLFTLGVRRVDEIDREDAEIAMKWMPKLGGRYLNLEAEVTFLDDPDDNRSFAVLADYFVNNDISVGPRVFSTTFDDDDPTYGLGVRFFIIPTASIELEYAYDSDNDDGGSLAAGLTMRF